MLWLYTQRVWNKARIQTEVMCVDLDVNFPAVNFKVHKNSVLVIKKIKWFFSVNCFLLSCTSYDAKIYI